MSEQYMYSDFTSCCSTDETISQSGMGCRVKSKIRILKLLITLLAVVLVLIGVLYLIVIPVSSQVRVTFVGLKTLQAAELGRELSLRCGSRWLGFDAALAVAQLSSYSAVESVSVEKRFPNRVWVTIKERTPVALSLTVVNGKTRPVQIDKNGIVFEADGSVLSGSLPLVSGLELNSFVDGMPLDPKFRPLWEQIALIQDNNPAYFSALSEIKVLPKGYGNYELALYPLYSRVRVLTDRKLSENVLQAMILFLEMAKDAIPNVSELDLRYGARSYK